MVSEDDLLKFALSLGEVAQKEDEKMRFLMRGEKIFLALSKGMTPVRVEVRCERPYPRSRRNCDGLEYGGARDFYCCSKSG